MSWAQNIEKQNHPKKETITIFLLLHILYWNENICRIFNIWLFNYMVTVLEVNIKA